MRDKWNRIYRQLTMSLLLVSCLSVWGQDPGRVEFDFIEKMKKAESVIRTLEREVKHQEEEIAAARKTYDTAAFKVTVLEKEARIRAAFLSSQAFGNRKQEKQLLRLREYYDNLVAPLEAKHNAITTPKTEKARLLTQLKPLYTKRSQILSQIAKLKKTSGLEARKRQARIKLVEARKRLDNARMALMEPELNLGVAIDLRDDLKANQQKAIDELARLRLKASQALARIQPPYISKVRVTSTDGATPYYVAEWTEEELRLRNEIEFYDAVVRAQNDALLKLKLLRHRLTDNLSATNKEWQTLNDQYIELIYSEAYANILSELFASTLGVLLNGKGTITVNLFAEALDRLQQLGQYGFGTSYLGYKKPDYGFPDIRTRKTGVQVEVPSAPLLTKDALKASLCNFVGSAATDKDYLAGLVRQHGAWCVFQAELIRKAEGVNTFAARHLKDARIMKSLGLGEISLTPDPQKLRELGKSSFKDFVKGQSINAAAQIGKDLLSSAEEDRVAVYGKMYILDLQWRAIVQELEAAWHRTRTEDAKLAAATELREETLRRLEDAPAKRYLKRLINEVALPDNGKVQIELTFSDEVKAVKGTFGGNPLPFPEQGTVVRCEAELEGLPTLAALVISAKGSYSDKALDAMPDSKAAYSIYTNKWGGYSPGADEHHKVMLKPIANGVSLVFLFDCSGSMGDAGKIGEAKAAAKKILADPSILSDPNSEIAVWCFVNGSPRIVQSFTPERQAVAKAIDSLGINGGTPLARSILVAGNYLINQGYFKRKAFVVLSDGEDTDNKNPHYAIQQIKERAELVRKEGW